MKLKGEDFHFEEGVKREIKRAVSGVRPFNQARVQANDVTHQARHPRSTQSLLLPVKRKSHLGRHMRVAMMAAIMNQDLTTVKIRNTTTGVLALRTKDFGHNLLRHCVVFRMYSINH